MKKLLTVLALGGALLFGGNATEASSSPIKQKFNSPIECTTTYFVSAEPGKFKVDNHYTDCGKKVGGLKTNSSYKMNNQAMKGLKNVRLSKDYYGLVKAYRLKSGAIKLEFLSVKY